MFERFNTAAADILETVNLEVLTWEHAPQPHSNIVHSVLYPVAGCSKPG